MEESTEDTCEVRLQGRKKQISRCGLLPTVLLMLRKAGGFHPPSATTKGTPGRCEYIHGLALRSQSWEDAVVVTDPAQTRCISQVLSSLLTPVLAYV